MTQYNYVGGRSVLTVRPSFFRFRLLELLKNKSPIKRIGLSGVLAQIPLTPFYG